MFFAMLAGCLAASNATVVTGDVTFDYYGTPQPVNSGTVVLNQEGSAVHSVSVVTGYDPQTYRSYARYAIEGVAEGTYTLVFRGQGYGSVKSYTAQLSVESGVDTLTYDIAAEDDPTHVFMTVVTYQGPYSWNSPTVPGVEVTCTLADEVQEGTTDSYGSIQFFCDTSSLYTLSFHKEGYEDTSFETKAVESSYYGGVSAKRVQVYLTEDLGVQVAVSGKVTLDGEEWDEFLSMSTEQIALVSSLDKTYTSRVVNGAYSFPAVTVGDARFFVQNTSGYQPTESKNFRIAEPMDGEVTLVGTAGETFTQDIVIERIGATVTGRVTGTDGAALRNQAFVRMESSDTVYSAYTDYSGAFSMDGIPEGTYALQLTSAGMDTATGQVEVDFAALGTGSVDAGTFELNPIATDIRLYGIARYYNNSLYRYDTVAGMLFSVYDSAGVVLIDSVRSDDKGWFETTIHGYLNEYYTISCTHPSINDYTTSLFVTADEMDLTGRLNLEAGTPDLYSVLDPKAEKIRDSLAVRLSWEWPQELLDDYGTTYQIMRITINKKEDMSEPYGSYVGMLMPVAGEDLPTSYVDTAVEAGATYFYNFEVQYSAPTYGSRSTQWNDSIMVKVVDTYALTLAADPAEGGTLSGAGEYEAGAEVSVEATANEGWRFVAWMSESDTLSKEAEYVFTIVSDTALTALFAEAEEPQPEMYTLALAADPAEGGTVSGAGEYEAGTEVSVEATASEGWKFVAWMSESDTLSKEAEYVFTIVSDTALTALFAEEEEPQPEMYTLVLAADPAEGGTVSGAGEYEAGTEVSVEATASEGWKFVAWMSESDTVSKEAGYVFTIVSDTALTALFAEETGSEALDADAWACYGRDGRILIENSGVPAVYEVFNLEGKLVSKGEGAATLYEVPVAVEGVYVVRFHSAEGIGVRKVFVR